MLVVVGILLISTITVNGQAEQEVVLLDKRTNPGGILKDIPRAAPRLEGSAYLFDEWKKMDATLRDGRSLEDVLFRYDLLNEIIEVKIDGVEKSVNPVSFVSFVVYGGFGESRYRYDVLKSYQSKEEGIVRVLYADSSLIIGEKPYVEVKEPTYVPTHHVGNANYEIVRKTCFYLIEGNSLYQFKRNKSSLSELFSMDDRDLKTYLKEEEINLKNDGDLVRAILYLSSLKE